jgi:histidine triad (HIT) family protein
MHRALEPKRVGMIVHGFGVSHAHLVVLPLEHPWDITAAQFSYIENGAGRFRWDKVELAPHAELDAMAERLRRELGSVT